MGQPATRARNAGILSICLLLLSSLGATGALAAAAPPQTAAPAAAAIVVGANSCVGTDACTFAVGPIGANSCNGSNACYNSKGPIGNNSCNGTQVCNYSLSVGNGSCNSSSLSVCTDDARVGNYSCNTSELGACANDLTGDCDLNDVTPTECIGPDLLIRRIGKHNMVGNNIYNTDGTDQTLTDTLAGRAVRFVIIIQNDGAVADSFTISASTGVFLIPGPLVQFYHGWPAQDISSDVITGTYATPTIAPGGVYRIRAVVRPSPVFLKPPISGPTPQHTWLVTATSVGYSGNADAVRFTVDVPFTI